MDSNLFAEALSPPAPTPKGEFCECSDPPLMILPGISAYNPFRCLTCRKEFDPKRLRIDTSLLPKLQLWRDNFNALDQLWLGSEYSDWALEKLSNSDSSVNLLGRQLCAMISEFHTCYYYYFEDTNEDWTPRETCPQCASALAEASAEEQICSTCRLVFSASNGLSEDTLSESFVNDP